MVGRDDRGWSMVWVGGRSASAPNRLYQIVIGDRVAEPVARTHPMLIYVNPEAGGFDEWGKPPCSGTRLMVGGPEAWSRLARGLPVRLSLDLPTHLGLSLVAWDDGDCPPAAFARPAIQVAVGGPYIFRAARSGARASPRTSRRALSSARVNITISYWIFGLRMACRHFQRSHQQSTSSPVS